MSDQPRALLLLGMHRSGTSALARLLDGLGVDFGRGHLPAGPANELGFFEKAQVADANERLLQALGLEGASDPRPLPPRWLGHPACGPIRAELAALLRADFADSPLWGVKDPRICRLAPLWIEVVRELGREPLFVHITRNPLEVADSLAARQGLDPRAAQLLWLRYVLEGERATRGHLRSFVTYEELLADWRGTAQRIGDALALAWPVDPQALSGEAEPALPGRLRHHVRDDQALSDSEGVSRWVATSYRALLGLREGSEPTSLRRLDRVRRNLEVATELLPAAMPAASEPEPPELRYVGTLRWDQGQLDARATVGEIVSGRRVELHLVAGHGSFGGFDLLFGTYARTNTSRLQVSLLVEGAGGALEPVHDWSSPAAEIRNDRWRAFRCPPQADSLGRHYVIRVESPDAAPGDAVTIYCDPEGAPAYRAYFVELSPQPRSEAPEASAELARLEERAARLEQDARERDAAIEELRAGLEASGAAVAAGRESLQDVGARLAALEPRVHQAERLRSELEQQQRRLEPLAEQLRVLRELYSANREAAESARRELRSRFATAMRGVKETVDELQRQLADAHQRLDAARQEEADLRGALEQSLRVRIDETDARRVEDARLRQLRDHVVDERLERLESILLSALERIDVVQQRADRDLAAIGAALEEAWE